MPPKRRAKKVTNPKKVRTSAKSTVVPGPAAPPAEWAQHNAAVDDVQQAMFRVANVGAQFLSDFVKDQPVNARGVASFDKDRPGIFFAGRFPSPGDRGGGHYKFADPKLPTGWACGYTSGFQKPGSDQFCQWNAYNLSKNNAWNLVPGQFGVNAYRIMLGLEKMWAECQGNHKSNFRDAVYSVYTDEEDEYLPAGLWNVNFPKDMKLIKRNYTVAIHM